MTVLDLTSTSLVDTPERLSLAFVEALSAGDHHAATACFARDACFLTPDATVIRGREEIHAVISQLTAMHFRVRAELPNMLTVGDVALGSERWTMTLAGSDGAPFVQTTRCLLAVGRREAGWRLLLAAPWGWR